MSGKIRGGLQSTRSVGKARVESGDCVLEGREVTLIKIDVEGFELQVLKGLERLIEEKRPKLLIETDELNGDEIGRFLSKFGYREVDEFRQYRALVNRFYVASNDANAQEHNTMC